MVFSESHQAFIYFLVYRMILYKLYYISESLLR